MKINFKLEEYVNGTHYAVTINSPDGQEFTVKENDEKEVIYNSREDFLKDFGELESWFW